MKKTASVLLRQQTFTLDEPGPVLMNVQTMIEMLGQGIPTTSELYHLPIKCLPELNERLTKPLVHKLKRPQLRSFPTIAGLFLLLRASGMVVGETNPRRSVRIDPGMRQLWESLNTAEKYWTLLENVLTECDLSILGERDSYGDYVWNGMFELFSRLDDGVTYYENPKNTPFYHYLRFMVASLLEQFGWIKIEYAKEVSEGKASGIRSIEKTEFGEAMFFSLGGVENVLMQDSSDMKARLRSLFPEWQNRLSLPVPTFRTGRFTLKLSWCDVWRRLDAPATTTLAEVCDQLLTAFNFDFDHLYQFSYRDSRGKNVVVTDARLRDGELFADEVRLGDLPLGEGESVELWYDFGADWKFSIMIGRIDDTVTKRFKPKITAGEGAAPKQYDFHDF
jgi:hypothetical protein